MGKRILGLSYVYPPCDAVGGRRFLNFINCLKKENEIWVISATEKNCRKRRMPINKDKLEKVRDIPVYRIPKFFISSKIEKLLWIVNGFILGLYLIKKNRIDTIIATGDPWFVVFTGALLKVFTGKKYIVDIRDPWSCNPFIKRGRISRKIEWFVLKSADTILLTTDRIKELYIQHFPEFKNKYRVVLNGINTDDMVFDDSLEFDWYENGKIHLIFSGNITPFREKPLKRFLEIIRKSDMKGRLRVVFYTNTKDVIKKYSHDIDVVINPYVPQSILYSAIKKSDITLLIDYSILEIATKLLEYVYMGKPVLAFIPEDSSNADIIKKWKVGKVIDNNKTDCELNEYIKYLLELNVKNIDVSFNCVSLKDTIN